MMIRIALIALVAFSAMAFWLHQNTKSEAIPAPRWSLDTLLGDAPEGFARVTHAVPFSFPKDHAMHPNFRNEWWYFTGRLDQPGRPLGFQFTLFRFGLTPNTEVDSTASPDSEWATDHLWMAHLALSDGGNELNPQPMFYQAERFGRDTLGMAGATEQRWWLRDWMVTATSTGWHLEAGTEEFQLSLNLKPTRPITLQGDHGFSQKGPELGNASHYYSLTRLDATGEIVLHKPMPETLSVDGLAWLDREWGSGQLSETQSGWDWFAIHLDDGRDLMVYRLRNLDGSASEFSAGVLVDASGQATVLGYDDFIAKPIDWWRDEEGVAWPIYWQLDIPKHQLTLRVEPIFEDQRWRKSVAYWEGGINVYEASTLVGRGYLELSGYAGSQRPGRRASRKRPSLGE